MSVLFPAAHGFYRLVARFGVHLIDRPLVVPYPSNYGSHLPVPCGIHRCESLVQLTSRVTPRVMNFTATGAKVLIRQIKLHGCPSAKQRSQQVNCWNTKDDCGFDRLSFPYKSLGKSLGKSLSSSLRKSLRKSFGWILRSRRFRSGCNLAGVTVKFDHTYYGCLPVH